MYVKTYKPTTRQPLPEVKVPKFSLADPTGNTFSCGEVDRTEMEVQMVMDSVLAFKEVKVQSNDLVKDSKRHRSSLFSAVIEVKQRMVQGLPSAPHFKELRREDRRGVGR